MSIKIKSGLSTNTLEISSNKETEIILPTSVDESGYVSWAGEVDDGEITGVELKRALDSSQDYRVRVGRDRIQWQDKFNYSGINSSNYSISTLNQTISQLSSVLVLNNGNSTTSGDYCLFETSKNFEVFLSFPVTVNMQISFSNSFQNNNVMDFGLGYTSTTSAPTDGVFFRASGGTLQCVVVNNSVSQILSTSYVPTVSGFSNYNIIFNSDKAEFWIDNALLGTIISQSGGTSIVRSNSFPFFARNYNTGTPASAVQLKMNQFTVSMADMKMDKSWESIMVGNGLSSISYPGSSLTGQTANIINNTSPISGNSLSNTSALYTTLGGQFEFSGQTSSETDYIIFGFQNSSGDTKTSGKNLIIQGVKINTFNGTVAGPASVVTMQWGLGFGSTDISLATTDSLTTGSRAPRKIIIGSQTFPASIAANTPASNPVNVTFKSPYLVEPGTYFHVILKIPLGGTPSVGQFYRGHMLVNGYFE